MSSIVEEEETQIEIQVQQDDELDELEQEPGEVGWLEKHGRKVNKARANGEKLIHYYDGLSPMVGISLCLDPTFKKISLKDMFDWKKEWVASVVTSFGSVSSV